MNQWNNVIIVNQHRDDAIGGSELQCDLIGSELVKRGYNVAYIAVNGTKKNYSKPYKVIACPNEADAIILVLQNQKPGIIYWRFNKHHFLPVAKWAYRKNIPFIFAVSHIRDLNPFIFKKKVGIRKAVKIYLKSLWNHLGFKYISALTVNNENHLHKSSIEPQIFVPNGALTEIQAFFWPRLYCAWVGSIKQVKRPELLIKLAEKFERKGMDFIMVGQVQEREYEWIKKAKNLPENVHYLGVKTPEEVSGIFKGAKLHIHTCYPEGFPNVFIQAWMQGTPSISLGFDPSNYITDNKLGEFANEDFTKFAGAVNEYLENDELRNEAGKNAKTFANSMFNIEKSVDMLTKLFEQVKSGRF